jgi:hypothetical protein
MPNRVLIPAERELIVRDDVGLSLRLGPTDRHHARHVGEAELFGRQDAPMPGNNPAGLVEQNRRRPAPFPNRRNELIHLLRAVRSRIARM